MAGCGGSAKPANGKLGVPVPWVRAQASGNGLRLGYESDPCTRARRARVEESGGTVKVTLGDPQRDAKKACVSVVEHHCVIVQLAKPLGTRKAVDGTPHARPRSQGVPIEHYGNCQPVQMDD